MRGVELQLLSSRRDETPVIRPGSQQPQRFGIPGTDQSVSEGSAGEGNVPCKPAVSSAVSSFFNPGEDLNRDKKAEAHHNCPLL